MRPPWWAPRPRSRQPGRWLVARQVTQFMVVGAAALLIVVVATAVASRRVGEREAIADARTTALVKAQSIVQPAISDTLVTGDPAAVRRIDRVVRESVLSTSLVRVKIWRRDGRILYSDEPRLIGTRYPLGRDEVKVLARGTVEAEVSDLERPENRFERDQGKLLEVYLPVQPPGGERLLFEAYFRYRAVAAAGGRIWRSFAPITIGALVVLELVQIPLAWSLARRLRDRQRERERLLQQTIDASEDERRRIAADLHDGVVQDLAGVAFSLAGSARGPDVPHDAAALLEESAAHVRSSIGALRTLLVDIYPPKLADAGLATALADLMSSAQARGLRTTLEVADLREPLPTRVAALLYRAAQEGLRNVATHARASAVTLRVAADRRTAMLDLSDDGVGFDPDVAASDAGRSGHIGLRSLTDRVAAAGGTVTISSEPSSGTVLHAEVPLT